MSETSDATQVTRDRWWETEFKPHPAKFNDKILDAIRGVLEARQFTGNVLDPFGGVGKIHDLDLPGVKTIVNELEPEWAAESARKGWTRCGDFLEMEAGATAKASDWLTRYREDGKEVIHAPLKLMDAIITSPTYANRMADKHVARDGSKRITYTHKLGRQLTRGNSGEMQWGDEYQTFHLRAWKHAVKLLVPGGLVIVNVKNHIRAGVEIDVVGWHEWALGAAGVEVEERVEIEVNGMGYGQHQHDKKVGQEVLLVGCAPQTPGPKRPKGTPTTHETGDTND